ncbi:hypothetical protein ACQP06_04165 [Nocardia sp. CA-136227]|uniref:hypothetical protein n=1 Tax=Nocardia sp. CA-136227 TaxID=3239979 RepID=UPI003D99D5EF
MRIRNAVATVGIALAGAAAATASAGSAAAFTPYSNPGEGIFLGVDLTHDETVALSNSWIPAAITQINGGHNMIAPDPTYSDLVVDGRPHGSMTQVVGEAADVPGGQVGLYLVDPARFRGGNFLLIQDLGGWDYYLRHMHDN